MTDQATLEALDWAKATAAAHSLDHLAASFQSLRARLEADDRDLYEALVVRQSVVPEGWKLVPVNLTGHIACALEECAPPDHPLQNTAAMPTLIAHWQPYWESVLAAAPEPPKPEDGEVELAALEPMCAECGQPTMHIGSICFACSRPSRNAPQQGERVAELERREKGMLTELHDVEQTLGKALGYPWFKDDQKNFPGATEVDGVCVGDHAPATLAIEAAAKITTLIRELTEARRELAEVRVRTLGEAALECDDLVMYEGEDNVAAMCSRAIRALATSSKGGGAK